MTVNPPAMQLYSLREQLAAGSRPAVLKSIAGFGYAPSSCTT
jgi:hypothetical protein